MTEANFDVVGIGNAIVDVIAQAKDEFLDQERIVKGTMALIDADRAEALYRMMGPAVEASGGSASWARGWSCEPASTASSPRQRR